MSYCYAMRFAGETEIKFGYAKDPAKRLRQLQTGQPKRLELIVAWPVKALPGRELPDKELHRRFAAYRVSTNGEWFTASQDVLAFIDEMLVEPNNYQRQMDIEEERAKELRLTKIEERRRALEESIAARKWLEAKTLESVKELSRTIDEAIAEERLDAETLKSVKEAIARIDDEEFRLLIIAGLAVAVIVSTGLFLLSDSLGGFVFNPYLIPFILITSLAVMCVTQDLLSSVAQKWPLSFVGQKWQRNKRELYDTLRRLEQRGEERKRRLEPLREKMTEEKNKLVALQRVS